MRPKIIDESSISWIFLTAKRSGPASNAQPIPPMFRDALFPLVGGYWKNKIQPTLCAKGFSRHYSNWLRLGQRRRVSPPKRWIEARFAAKFDLKWSVKQIFLRFLAGTWKRPQNGRFTIEEKKRYRPNWFTCFELNKSILKIGLQKSLSETCNVRNLEFKILLIKKGSHPI